MIRRIIQIDEEKCNGCGACAAACHEGAIGMADGKAKLLKDDYCDGLGDCLPTCPTGAITFVEREAAAYDEAAVKARMAAKMAQTNPTGQHPASGQSPAPSCPSHAGGNTPVFTGCPGSMSQRIIRNTPEGTSAAQPTDGQPTFGQSTAGRPAFGQPAFGQSTSRQAAYQQPVSSCLSQWPVQIKLAPIKAPYFDGAKLLIAADCTAYAYGNFHQDFIRGKVTLIGCPKLDAVDYTEKLTEIIKNNDIKSVTVTRMVVPCCGGIENAVKQALMNSGKFIPWQVVTISTDGTILD